MTSYTKSRDPREFYNSKWLIQIIPLIEDYNHLYLDANATNFEQHDSVIKTIKKYIPCC